MTKALLKGPLVRDIIPPPRRSGAKVLKSSACYRCKLKVTVVQLSSGRLKTNYNPPDWRDACEVSGRQGLYHPSECRCLTESLEDQAKPEWDRRGDITDALKVKLALDESR